MASNQQFPRYPHRGPPPPPPPPRSNGAQLTASFQSVNVHDNMGSLCPPPPPPQSNNAQYHQQMPSMGSMPPRGYQQQYSSNPSPISQYQHYQAGPPAPQHQHYQQMPQHQYNQYSNPHYTNYASAPPPPPPPPPPPRQSAQNHNGHRYNNNNAGRLSHGANANASAAASLRQSLHTNNNTHGSADNCSGKNSNNKPKKINPKMAKKYSGRGLKTITISGPGMPTQRFKICVGNHPEDVKKWIEERRKRFPRRDGSHRKRSTSQVHGGGNDGEIEDSIGKKRSERPEGEQEKVANKRTCFDEKTKSNVATGGEGDEKGNLSALLGGYGSSSSEEDPSSPNETPGEGAPASAAPLPPSEADGAKSPAASDATSRAQPKRICRYHQRGKCRHGAACKFLHADAPATDRRQSQSERDRARNRRERELQALGLATPGQGNRRNGGGKVVGSTSLLHKLLQRDKERERRLTLQLLRYIVDCNYFQGGDASEPSVTTAMMPPSLDE